MNLLGSMDTTFRMLYPFHIGVVPADSCYNFSKIARVTIVPMSVPVSVSVLPTLSSSIWSINFVYIKSCSGSYSFLLNVLNLYHFWLNVHLQIFTDLKAQILASQVSFVSSLNAVATTNVLCRKFLSVELPMNLSKKFYQTNCSVNNKDKTYQNNNKDNKKSCSSNFRSQVNEKWNQLSESAQIYGFYLKLYNAK